jgi:hypothetical protein
MVGMTPIGVGFVFSRTAGCTCGYPYCCPPDGRIFKTRHNEWLAVGILYGVSLRRLLQGLKGDGDSWKALNATIVPP